MYDLVCDVPRLNVRSAPVVEDGNILHELHSGYHFKVVSGGFRTIPTDKTKITWATNAAGEWVQVKHGQRMYFKLAGKPFNPQLG